MQDVCIYMDVVRDEECTARGRVNERYVVNIMRLGDMCLDLLCTLCEVGDQAHSKACVLPVGGAHLHSCQNGMA